MRFMLFVVLLGTVVVATLGATIAAPVRHTMWVDEWRVILVGNGLAALVLTPVLLNWVGRDRSPTPPEERREFAWIAGIATGACVFVFALALLPHFPAELLRAQLSLVLVWTAIRGQLKAASLCVLVAAGLGIGLTFFGLGPYGPTNFAVHQDAVWSLQLDLAGLAILSFFVAIAVHERRTLDLRLNRARRFESLGLMAGSIAHDFNNILGTVGGYTELASEQISESSAAQRSLREAAHAVVRGKNLAEQILLAGVRTDRARACIDLRDIVLESLALTRPLWPASLALDVGMPDTCVPVLAHEGQVVRALMNLLRNASKAATGNVSIQLVHAPSGGNAIAGSDHCVGDVPEGKFAWVDVTDDGHGIAAGHMHQLFDPFFSSRNAVGNSTGAAKDVSKGTGLGLTIVAGVACDHAGGVAVWSGHGAATRFRFMLPLATSPVAVPALVPPGQGQTVLLVAIDDQSMAHEEDFLAGLGFEPMGFTDLGIALDELAKAPSNYWLLMAQGLCAVDNETLVDSVMGIAPDLPVICACDADQATPIISQSALQISLPKVHDLASLHKAIHLANGAKPPLGKSTEPLKSGATP
jgi:signal transduction histidine kinase